MTSDYVAQCKRSLPTHQDVSGSIPSPAVGFFCTGELFYGLFGLGLSVFSVSFIHVMSCNVFEEGPFILPDHSSGEVLQLGLYSCVLSRVSIF